jgi:GT2 family glycosyltransferase
MRMKINISIVTYKTKKEELLRCIDSIVKDVMNATIYIIDNSPDNTISFYLKNNDNIKYIHNPRNTGYGAGHNIAIKFALEDNIDYHLVINPDVNYSGAVVTELVCYMEDNKSIGQIMPKVKNYDGTNQFLCKMIPTPFDLLLHRFPRHSYIKSAMNKYELLYTNYNKIMFVPFLSGCFMLFRVSSLKKIGLFDERFFMYLEDTDITRRMAENYDTIFYPYCSIYHGFAGESRRSIRMLLIHAISLIRYFNKWGWFIDKRKDEINKKTLLLLGKLRITSAKERAD